VERARPQDVRKGCNLILADSRFSALSRHGIAMADGDKAEVFKQLARVDERVVLERMKLHGFWPPNQEIPADPPAEAAERTDLEREIAELSQAQAATEDPAAALAQERKRRWEESKKRRAEAKAKREAQQEVRRKAWDTFRAGTVVFAGEGVSGGLQNATSDAAALSQRGLPILHSAADLAGQMGIPLSSLRWLTYHRRGATLVHYHRYCIAKKTGGVRSISAPKSALKSAQAWVRDNILDKLPFEAPAHGFVASRSIVTNARHHVNKSVVINLDMKDFFPSITFRRVKGLFEQFGYSEQVAVVLALLCTEPPRVPAELDGKVYFVALGERVLPQGASTSPALTNLLCRKLDRRLAGLAKKHQFVYTRYADDLTFSGHRLPAVGRLLRSVRSILQAEGLAEHPNKTRVMRASNRQEVTGVTVNERPTIGRKEIRVLRAILHQAAKHGLASQNREGRHNFAEYLRGRVAFVCMVDPQRGEPLKLALAKALERGE
jgi:RNA-directed DNA polymerase